tara:strand:- start:4135 stop:4308 length:174 start_codon:yes stop_codon:yes gene_type:complete
MWKIEITHIDDYREGQTHSMKQMITDQEMNSGNKDIFLYRVQQCIDQVKKSMDNIES